MSVHLAAPDLRDRLAELAPDRAWPATALELFAELAEVAPRSEVDLSPAAELLRPYLSQPELAPLAGAALWRVTWRVNRDWLEGIDPSRADARTLGLVAAALTEHLGRRPDLAPLVRRVLVALVDAVSEEAPRLIRRLASLGPRGWGVLLPLLHDRTPEGATVPDTIKMMVVTEAVERPGFARLVHPHAHRFVAERAMKADAVGGELLEASFAVLAALGHSAGTALPDLLLLVTREPEKAPDAARVVAAVAPGFPLAVSSIIRALNALKAGRRPGGPEPAESRDAFAALGPVLFGLNPDAAAQAADDLTVSLSVPDSLLDLPPWRDAPADLRLRHARMLADRLASPRFQVRIRAAELLRHYQPELPAVWPAIVAGLAGSDEAVGMSLLGYFRSLAPVADDAAAELRHLLREPEPAYAARAAVALWRLGRWNEVAPWAWELVAADADSARGWEVLTGIIDRAGTAHGLHEDLTNLFADAPAAVQARLLELLRPHSTPADHILDRLIPRPDGSEGPAAVDWEGVWKAVEDDRLGYAVVVALMAAFGTEGVSVLKIRLIKANRERTGRGLAEAKNAVERAMSLFGPRPGAADRQKAVEEFFPGTSDLPAEVRSLLDHPAAWFRWAGLELTDCWGLPPARLAALIGDRVRDRSPLVRARAARMVG